MLDLAAAVILSGYAVALVSGVIHTSHPHGGGAASVGVLAMTLPVAWRRPAPLAAAAVMAAAALLNGLVFGPMVRCGAFLPAIFLVAYAAGVRRDRAWLGRGAAALRRRGRGRGPLRSADRGPGPGLRAACAGRLLRLRAAGPGQDADGRRAPGTSAELRRQREDTARLAVLADRARVTARPRAVPARPDRRPGQHRRHRARRAGRRPGRATRPRPGRRWPRSSATAGPSSGTCGRCSAPCRSARPASPSSASRSRRWPGCRSCWPGPPPPTPRLTVDGSPRTLPAGLELSGYRIVEHLLLALEDAPGSGRRRAAQLHPGRARAARVRAARAERRPARGAGRRRSGPACTAGPWTAGWRAGCATPWPGCRWSAAMPEPPGEAATAPRPGAAVSRPGAAVSRPGAAVSRPAAALRPVVAFGSAAGGDRGRGSWPTWAWSPGPGTVAGWCSSSRSRTPPPWVCGAGGRWPPPPWPARLWRWCGHSAWPRRSTAR